MRIDPLDCEKRGAAESARRKASSVDGRCFGEADESLCAVALTCAKLHACARRVEV
jgi:hypothetical protein